MSGVQSCPFCLKGSFRPGSMELKSHKEFCINREHEEYEELREINHRLEKVKAIAVAAEVERDRLQVENKNMRENMKTLSEINRCVKASRERELIEKLWYKERLEKAKDLLTKILGNLQHWNCKHETCTNCILMKQTGEFLEKNDVL